MSAMQAITYLRALYQKCRKIADEARQSYADMEVTVPHIRRTAATVDEAGELAERSQKPVDTSAFGHPVTVFPIGQVPRVQF